MNSITISIKSIMAPAAALCVCFLFLAETYTTVVYSAVVKSKDVNYGHIVVKETKPKRTAGKAALY